MKVNKIIKEGLNLKPFNTEGAVGMSVRSWCNREGIDPYSEIDLVSGMNRLWQTKDIAKNLNAKIVKAPYRPESAQGANSPFITIPINAINEQLSINEGYYYTYDKDNEFIDVYEYDDEVKKALRNDPEIERIAYVDYGDHELHSWTVQEFIDKFGADDEDEDSSLYVKVDSKRVKDSDGFWTDYTMYYNTEEDNYFFIFGDKDLYRPDPAYADWECDTEEEAREWLNGYTGFEDEVDECLHTETSLDEHLFDETHVGDLVVFPISGMTDIPKVNSDFRVGPLVGKCVSNDGTNVTMKVEHNSFSQNESLELSEDVFDETEIGDLVVFPIKGMTDIPQVGEKFRVGPLVGNCVSNDGTNVTMKVVHNTFKNNMALELSEDIFDDIIVKPIKNVEVEIPAAEIAPVTVEPELSQKTPNNGPDNGIASLLISAIKDEWNTIGIYNDLIVTADTESFPEIANIVRDITAEENNHVGMLQKALSTISPNTENIAAGEIEASQELKEDWDTAKRWNLDDKREVKKLCDNLYVYCNSEYIDSAIKQASEIIKILNKIKQEMTDYEAQKANQDLIDDIADQVKDNLNDEQSTEEIPMDELGLGESIAMQESYISDADMQKLTKTSELSKRALDKLNKLVYNYNGWKTPQELSNMWKDLSEAGVEVGLITGDGTIQAEGTHSWKVPFTLNGVLVDNSMFVFNKYEGKNGPADEYNIYFS